MPPAPTAACRGRLDASALEARARSGAVGSAAVHTASDGHRRGRAAGINRADLDGSTVGDQNRGVGLARVLPGGSTRGTQGFLDPAARVYTIAGGGTSAPRDGIPATDALLRIARVAAAPDGTIVFTEETGARAGWRIDLAGRLRALPAIVVDGRRTRARDIDVSPDGTLLAVGGDDGRVYRLAPRALGWQPSPRLVDFGLDEVVRAAGWRCPGGRVR